MSKSRVSETSEQIKVVWELRRLKLLFTSTLNGERLRSKSQAKRVKAAGMEKGVPDLLIFEPPEGSPYVGVALEMKREGGVRSDVRKEQREWMARLQSFGWACIVGYGARDALTKLCALGYDVRV